MGTLVMQLRTSFKILAKNKASVLAEIKKMPGKERFLDLDPENHFAYIDFEDVDGKRKYLFESSETVEEALREWNWYPKTDILDNITNLVFYGFCEGDYDILFATIAPWVESGSYIEMANEDGCRYRFDFQDGKMTEINLKKIPGLDSGAWDNFWQGKQVIRAVFTHYDQVWRVETVDVKRNLRLEFTKDEISSQQFLEVSPEEDAYVFAPHEKSVFVFRVEKAKSNKGYEIPLLCFVCKY